MPFSFKQRQQKLTFDHLMPTVSQAWARLSGHRRHHARYPLADVLVLPVMVDESVRTDPPYVPMMYSPIAFTSSLMSHACCDQGLHETPSSLTSSSDSVRVAARYARLISNMLTLILGGARSGKSRYAQALCQDSHHVIYLATAAGSESDEEMRTRIARHRADRSSGWATVEEPLDVVRVMREAPPSGVTILVDCVTVWLANLGWEHRGLAQGERESLILERVAEFAQVARERAVIAVSNEVGSGIVPENPVARSFRDLQGLANQLLAREAQHVVLVVAGLPLPLKGVQL